MAAQNVVVCWGGQIATDPDTGEGAYWEYHARCVAYHKYLKDTKGLVELSAGLWFDLYHTVVKTSPMNFVQSRMFGIRFA